MNPSTDHIATSPGPSSRSKSPGRFPAYLLITVLLLPLLTGCGNSLPGNSYGEMLREAAGERNTTEPLVLLVSHSADTAGGAMESHIARTLEYARISYAQENLAGKDSLQIPHSVRTLVLATDRTKGLDRESLQRLAHFVNRGGDLILTRPVWDERMMFLQGLQADRYPVSDTTASGLIFHTEPFPGFGGAEDSLAWEGQKHRGFPREQFRNNVTVHASAMHPRNYPVLLERPLGAGSVYLYNSIALADRQFRTLYFSNILKSLPGLPYPVTAVSTIFLDDFPAPYYNKKMEPIAREYDITQAEFVYNEWWPDMKRLADSLRITYTTALVFNYNQKLRPHFDFPSWDVGRVEREGQSIRVSQRLAEDVQRSRHELGFHGYNHVSPDTSYWPSGQNIRRSVESARRMWFIRQLGDHPVTYVPPHNNIDRVGFEALTEAMPDLRISSSIMGGTFSKGERREFGPEPVARELLFAYPRSSNGFTVDNSSIFLQHSQLLLTGAWNHFVHPDDVFDMNSQDTRFQHYEPRNPQGLGWKDGLGKGPRGMFPIFRDRLKKTKTWYPLLDFVAAREGAPAVRRTLETEVSRREIGRDMLTLRAAPGDTSSLQDWFVYVPQELNSLVSRRLENLSTCRAGHEMWDGRLLQFSSRRDSLLLPFPRVAPDQQALAAGALDARYERYERVRKERLSPGLAYAPAALDSLRERYQSLPDSVREDSTDLLERLVQVAAGTGRSAELIPLLKRELFWKTDPHPMTVERLFTFYGWNGRTAEAWDLLERRWQRSPGSRTLELQRRLRSRTGWPGPAARNRWVRRTWHTHPDSLPTVRRAAHVLTAEATWESGKKATRRLIRSNPHSDTLYAHLLQHAFWYEAPDSVLAEADRLPSHAYEQVRPWADNLAHLYVERRRNYRQALSWADRAFEMDRQTVLYWQVMSGQMERFRQTGRQALRAAPGDDSLRAYVGLTLFYGEGRDEAWPILRPFLDSQRDDSLSGALRREISYLPYDRRLSLYRSYPSFFTDTLRTALHQDYRSRRQLSVRGLGVWRSDNFGHRVGQAGLGATLRRGPRNRHSLDISEFYLRSGDGQDTRHSRLFRLDYGFTRTFPERGLELHAGGGFRFRSGHSFPVLRAGLTRSAESSYISAMLRFRPVYTPASVELGISELSGELYYEHSWLGGRMRTGLNARPRYFTDRNFSMELGLTAYFFPRQYGPLSISPVGYTSVAGAHRSRISGVPYYAPRRRMTNGAGISARYTLPGGETAGEVQLRGNRDSKTPFFGSLSASVSAPITDEISLQAEGYFSTSRLYRTNRLSFTLSFALPEELPEPRPRRRPFEPSPQASPPTTSMSAVCTDCGEKPVHTAVKTARRHTLRGQVSTDSTVAASLHRRTVHYRGVDNGYRGRTRTYYDGSFAVEGLPAGTYRIWTDAGRELAASPDTATISLGSGENGATTPLARLTLTASGTGQNVNPADMDQTGNRWQVALPGGRRLDEALALMQQAPAVLRGEISPYYIPEADSVQLRSRPFTTREAAHAAADSLRASADSDAEFTGMGSARVVAVDSSTAQPATYRFRFGSYRSRQAAMQHVRELQEMLPGYRLRVRTDPVAGRYYVSTRAMRDWRHAKGKMEMLWQQVGYGEVTRQVFPDPLYLLEAPPPASTSSDDNSSR